MEKKEIKAEIMKIINKIVGKTSFLDVCFLDSQVISSLKQIDYIEKQYEFKNSIIEFLNLKNINHLYEVVKKYSLNFNLEFDKFCEELYFKFSQDILKNVNFTHDETKKIINTLRSYPKFNEINLDITLNSDKITYSYIFSEIIKSLRNVKMQLNTNESEIMFGLYKAIYENFKTELLNKGLALLNQTKRIKDVINFLSTLEKTFKIKFNYLEVGNSDIFTTVFKLLSSQRPDLNFNKANVEQEIMTIAAKVFNDSNIILNLINAIEEKYKVRISKDESIFAGSFDMFVNAVSESIKKQQPQVATSDVALDIMTFASDFMSKHNIKVATPKLTSAMQNKFIDEIEKRFRITFSVFDLLEITGLDSTIKIVDRLIKKQKIKEKYPGLVPESNTELLHFIRRELIKISRDNMIISNEMFNTSMEGLDFPKKIDSMLAIEVVVQLEKHFKIKIPEDKLHSVKTIDDMTNLVYKLIEEKNNINNTNQITTKDRL